MNVSTRAILALSLVTGQLFGQMPGSAEHVQVEKTTKGKDRIYRKSIGHTEAIHTVHVRPAVEGFLQAVKFQEGSMVKEGDVLFEINPTRYQAAVRQAEAALAQIEAQTVYAANNYKRLAKLSAAQATSKEDTETALARLEELKASKAGAEADLTKARKDLADCTIRAEITGRIGRLNFTPGNYITQGEELVTISQFDPIYVRFPLSQADVNGIFRGPKEISHVVDVRLVTASGRQYPSPGSISIVDNLVTGETDTYTLWASFDNPDHVLTPRGVGAIRVSLTDTEEVCMVPLTAVHHDAAGAYVYVVDADNTVVRKEVISGTIQGRFQSIYHGLKEGETVITDGAHKTRVGSKVIPVFADIKDTAGNARPISDDAPISITTATVGLAPDPTVIECQGAQVQAINRIELRPLVQGVLGEHTFKEGDRVMKDDILFTIDPTRYQAVVDSQKSKIAQLDVKIEDARTKFARKQELMARHATSQDELESAKATLDDLIAQKSSAEAALVIAEDDLSRCTIRAGVSGRIGRVFFSKGNYITDIKSPLATLVQLSPIYVRFSLSENTILSHFGNDENLQRDADITLVTANGMTYPEKGRVSFCDNIIQTETDTQNFWAVFENSDMQLVPGAVVTIRITRKPDKLVPTVPAEAVLTDTMGHYVFVVKGNHVALTRVLCGSANEKGNIPVFDGLKQGEQVAISKLAELEDGSPVTTSGNAQ